MTSRGRLSDELRRLGSSPVPVLDQARARRIEGRVLGAMNPRELELVDAVSIDALSIDAPRASRRRAVAATIAAACVLAVIVIATLDRAGSTDRILFTSGDVEVVLPDGSVLDGSARMNVPDGAILRLGSDGEASVDGITISGTGDYLVTPDGLTLLNPPSPPGATSQAGTLAEDPPTNAAEAPADSRPPATEPDSVTTVLRPTTTERDSAITVVRPTTTSSRESATTAVRPSTSQRVAPAPQPPPAGSSDPQPTAAPSPTTSTTRATIPPPPGSDPPSIGPALLDVTVRSDGRRVVFAWRSIAGATSYAVVAVPAVGDGESPWPPAPGVEVTELSPGTLQHSVARPTDGAWSYRVAALGPDGRTLALSRVLTIAS